jgi:serine/threonine protein kinase
MATCPTCRTHYDDAIAVCTKDGARLLPDEAFTNADTDLPAGTQVGEYRVEEKLGEGGFGAVYRARHPLIGKAAAIKVLAREFSAKPDIVARFIDEARAVNQIRHKGIIDIFSFGALPDGRHYFVMELLEGMPLDAYLRQRGRLRVEEALPILRGIARAVDAAHQAGIAHRDLKPDNTFLVFDEDGGAHTKLLDFGIAKLLTEQSGRTRTGTPIGTPQYMSPEQARGLNVDTRTDVYSFGAMVFEMLTGRVPFEGVTVMDTLVKQMSDPPPVPSAVCVEVPAPLDAPILRMLEKEPDKRPPTLGAALDELSEAAARAGVPVAPTSKVQVDANVREAVARTLVATPPASSPQAASLVGAATEVGPHKPRRSWLFIAVPAALAAGAAALIAMRMPHAPRDAPSAQPTTAASATPSATAAPAPTAAPSAAPDEEVKVTVRSTPPNAEVFEGDKPLGLAPGPLRLSKRAGTTKLTFKAPGYLPRDVDVSASGDGVVSVALTPRPKRSAPSSASTHAGSPDLPPF